ncbi:MAG: hypothetical protein ACREOI_07650 [bacterium]
MSQETSAKPDSTAKPYPEAESSSEQIGKVAEAVATYAVRSEPRWKAPSQKIAGLAANDEVWTFVKANDLLPHLETAIQLVRKTFLDVHEMWLSYEPDPEIPKFNSIGIWVKARGTVEVLFEQEKKYIRAFNEVVPSEHCHQISLLLGLA